MLAGATAAVVLLAANSCTAAAADRMVVDPALGADDPGERATRVAAVLAALKPRHTLFAESLAGGDLARRVAALTGLALFPDAEMITGRAVTRACRARTREATAPPGALIGLALDVAAEYAGLEREGRVIEPAIEPTAARAAYTALSPITRDPGSTPLAEAEFVVAAGNGITDFPAFRRLVAVLGATPGASRAVCDAGDMPRDRQVGASGTVLAGRCYMALGIAGAPQHLQGIGKVEHVVAVNTDLHAAMVKRAGLAIVADAQRIMPALIDLIEAGMR